MNHRYEESLSHSPWAVRKVKALLWYWLNFHPAETSMSSPLGKQEYGMSPEQDFYNLTDASICKEDGWIIGYGSSSEYYVLRSDLEWYDINRCVKLWFLEMDEGQRSTTVNWLTTIKGEPLGKWHTMYHPKAHPIPWRCLVDCIFERNIIQRAGEVTPE